MKQVTVREYLEAKKVVEDYVEQNNGKGLVIDESTSLYIVPTSVKLFNLLMVYLTNKYNVRQYQYDWTVDHLLNISPDNFMGVRNVGKKTMDELQSLCAFIGKQNKILFERYKGMGWQSL